MRAGSSRNITGIEIPLTGRYTTRTWQGSSTPWYKHERTSKLHTQECDWKCSGLHDSATHNSAMAGQPKRSANHVQRDKCGKVTGLKRILLSNKRNKGGSERRLSF